jgi:hypothetical protein
LDYQLQLLGQPDSLVSYSVGGGWLEMQTLNLSLLMGLQSPDTDNAIRLEVTLIEVTLIG